MTKGEYLVGINFNPSNDDMVSQIKRRSADLIDLIESISVASPPSEGRYEDVSRINQHHEVARLKALARTDVENAAMWAVKAATKPAFKQGSV
jgi:hypothetical protein